MRCSIRFLLVLLLFCGVTAAEEMTSQECGTCHESQYDTWKQGKHNMRLGQCSACHGEFHSGSLKGCTGCHSASHEVQYRSWEFVQDYIVEGDTSDYYCIRCHDPHDPAKAEMQICSTCHGSRLAEAQPRKAIRLAAQETHNLYAWMALPIEEMQLGKMMKTTRGKVMVAGGAAFVGLLLVVPYLYTGFVFFRWVLRKVFRRRGNRPL
jgi:hypothetical protein